MPIADYSRLFPFVCVGFGLFLAGAASLLFLRRGFVVKAAAVLVACGAAVAAAAALRQTNLTTTTAQYLAIALSPFLLLGSRRVTSTVASIVTVAQRPAVRSGLLATVGLGLMIGSVVVFDAADEHALDSAMAELEMMRGQTPTIDSDRARATTDKGQPVALREPAPDQQPVDFGEVESKVLTNSQLNDQIIRRGPADDHTNCHGWVFTGGKFRVSGEDVELILKDNGYQEVHEPQADDLVVYRQNGGIAHTALVRYVTEGQPVLVESKWGNMGLFLHPADRSVYGTDYTFHRSPRTGHLLVGVGGTATSTGNKAVVAEE